MLPFPTPGDLPDPGIKFASPASAGGLFTTETTGKPHLWYYLIMVGAVVSLLYGSSVSCSVMSNSL